MGAVVKRTCSSLTELSGRHAWESQSHVDRVHLHELRRERRVRLTEGRCYETMKRVEEARSSLSVVLAASSWPVGRVLVVRATKTCTARKSRSRRRQPRSLRRCGQLFLLGRWPHICEPGHLPAAQRLYGGEC